MKIVSIVSIMLTLMLTACSTLIALLTYIHLMK